MSMDDWIRDLNLGDREAKEAILKRIASLEAEVQKNKDLAIEAVRLHRAIIVDYQEEVALREEAEQDLAQAKHRLAVRDNQFDNEIVARKAAEQSSRALEEMVRELSSALGHSYRSMRNCPQRDFHHPTSIDLADAALSPKPSPKPEAEKP